MTQPYPLRGGLRSTGEHSIVAYTLREGAIMNACKIEDGRFWRTIERGRGNEGGEKRNFENGVKRRS